MEHIYIAFAARSWILDAGFLNTPRCNHVETNVFASDPSKSKAAGSLSGELGRSTVAHEISEGKLISKSAKGDG